MRRNRMMSMLAVPMICMCLLVNLGGAQDPPPVDKPVLKSPVRGRLPAYFAAVVSKKQREEIYRIQARMQAEIDQLRVRIAELETSRDAEVDAVLTEEQLAKVKEKRMAAAERRRNRSASGKFQDTKAATD